MLCSYEDQLNRQQIPNHNNNMVNPPAHQASMGWYAGYHQGAQMYPPANAYYVHQEEQNMWNHHHHHHHVPQHSPVIFSNDYADFLGHNNYMQPAPMHPLPVNVENQIPSPPCGSEMSSSSTGGNITPPAPVNTRPTPVRSPYEWIKKPSYQNQPNPGR
ncbi:hypothetical protein WA026_006045 [Henosepilachna vigintioctopunctata]|uniref:Uncharacterized protein n=1 Tax=Henosepilachna vigintioctopunctata TaxID=420089 RepID=A0AAW1TNN4_9CUCU